MAAAAGDDPGGFLAGLNEPQRAAASRVTGPVVIHAGAGTGKTRVITHRAAHAAAVGAMDPAAALLVTFTRKAADEMAARLRAMGVAGATASTFHATAWRILRHFWPQVHAVELRPLDNPWQAVNPLVRRLPGRYRFTATRDVLETIAWIKSRRITMSGLAEAAESAGRALPIPVDLLAGIYDRYEQGKAERNLVDFEDMVLRCTDLLTDSPDIRQQVQQRYRWFSVDEFQDTNTAQYGLLQLWLGDSRDICVVGDENQTIYSFTGATSRYLTGFAADYRDAAEFDLRVNYRSTPQILQCANRLIAAAGGGEAGLTAVAPDGPVPAVRGYDSEEEECRAVAAQVRVWADSGIPLHRIAILVRLNADTPPLEAALAAAGVAFRVRGKGFFQRREVRDALRELARSSPEDGEAPLLWCDRIFRNRLGYAPDTEPETPEQRERQASLTALQQIVTEVAEQHDHTGLIEELRRRSESEQKGVGDAAELATLHGAKGLEWDAVLIPGLEQGHLPVQQSLKDPLLLAEERRLLYVGITRARQHLVLSWAARRPVPGKADRSRRRSQFLADLFPSPPRESRTGRGPAGGGTGPGGRTRRVIDAAPGSDEALFERLRAWRRTRAAEDNVPAYIVLPDSTLWLIARERPTTLTALGRIHGIGPAKLEKHGTEVLEQIRSFLAEPPPG